MSDELYPAIRLSDAAAAAGLAGLDALLLTPGPDLRYVVGYDAHALERLTCLAVVAGHSRCGGRHHRRDRFGGRARLEGIDRLHGHEHGPDEAEARRHLLSSRGSSPLPRG